MNDGAEARWQRVESVLDEVMDLPVAQRRAALDAACGAEPEVRAEVERLLVACDEADGFMERPEGVLASVAESLFFDRGEDPSPGAVVSHYEIMERHASGGMGVVFRARDTRLDRVVAMKFLPRELATDEHARKRLLGEARALSALEHPNLAVVHEIGETADGWPFIVMGWYEGATLRDLLGSGPIEPTDALRLAVQVAAGLGAAHRAGVIHRDVKPSNILVLVDGTAKLIDFGIARFAGAEATREQVTRGTLAYMSPEQTRGGVVDARTDIWSLGVVLYEMLTGLRPFRGDDEGAVLYAIRHDEPVPVAALLPGVPPALNELVTSCMAKEAHERCASADELLERLLALAGTTHTAGGPPRRRTPASDAGSDGPLLRRRPRLIVASAVLAVAVGVAGYLGSAKSVAVLDPARIAVSPFENRTGDSNLDGIGAMAADGIAQGFAETRLVDVVVVPIAPLAAQLTLAAGGSPERATAATIAHATGSGLVISGAYYLQGETLYLRAVVVDAVADRLLYSVESEPVPAAAPLAAIERLRERLMSALAPRLFHALDYETIVDVPPSFEAYSAFIQGLRYFVNSELRSSIPYFAEAAAHDPAFVLPLIHMGVAFSLLADYRALDSLLTAVRPGMQAMSEVDRLGFEVLDARLRGDFEAFYRLSARGMAIAPRTAMPWQLANSAVWVNKPHEVVRHAQLTEYERGMLRGWRVHWTHLTWAHHSLGNHREELRVARRARELFPRDTFYVFLEARALAALRRTRQLRTLLEQQVEGSPHLARLLHDAGTELRLHGARSEGEKLLRQSLDLMLTIDDAGRAVRLMAARTHAALGELDEADRILRELDRESPGTLEVIAARGSVAARRGERQQAQEFADWLAAYERPHLHGAATYARARIAAQQGDRAAAVRLLRQAYREGSIVWLIMHRDPDLAPLHDYPPFLEFIRPRG